LTGERVYVDVGARSIQHYISRTPRLKGQRGASAWLSDATSHGAVEAFLEASESARRHGAEVNPEAGEADGIVSVRFPAEHDPEAAAAEIASGITAYLRLALPSIELDALWGTGASYLEAYRDGMKDQRADPPLRDFPPLGDFPPLVTCAECRADPAIDVIGIHDDENVPVCLDCLSRYEDRYRKPGLARRSPEDHGQIAGLRVYREECRVATALGRHPVAGTVQDFTELASLGGEDTNRNHVATMYADGNLIGAFFDRVIAYDDPDLKARISAGVSAATRTALREAVRAIADSDLTVRLPVIPHVVGGDDLIVTLTADRAWPFTLAYLREFARAVSAIEGLPAGLLEPLPPSASAGLVFAHAKFPFRRAAELAANQLRAAKKQFLGTEPAVAWLDVTRDGEQAPTWQRPWRLADLVGLSDALRALRAEIAPSGLATLTRLVDPSRPELSLARIREHARRLERGAVLEPFLRSGDALADGERIAAALALAGWWR
jgi:hypothetical protein